jgi:hypothetical protein
MLYPKHDESSKVYADLDIDIVYSGGITNLPQLTSAFYDQSTYLPLRATLFTDSIVHSPATNFTICDLPCSKFGFSADSDCSYGSFFLKCIGQSALFRENMIKKNDLEEFLSKYTAISFKDDSTWKYFHTSVKNMCTQLENGQSVNVLKIFSDEKLAKLPTMLSSTVSQANKQIKEILLKNLSKGFN